MCRSDAIRWYPQLLLKASQVGASRDEVVVGGEAVGTQLFQAPGKGGAV